jgi:hypothetical protein
VTYEEVTEGSYAASLPDCALDKMSPFWYIDASVGGGHAAKVNFAPRTINGAATLLQNTKIKLSCTAPYVFFATTREVKKGEEFLTTYGKNYRKTNRFETTFVGDRTSIAPVDLSLSRNMATQRI